MDFCGPYDKQLAKQHRPSLLTPLLAGWEFWQKPVPSTSKAGWLTMADEQEWILTKSMQDHLRSSKLAVVITDMNQLIQYVNNQFEQMTGYSHEEVVGRQPNFLQGEATSSRARWRMKQAIEQQKVVSERVLNYRKDHTPYWCHIKIRPILNRHKQVVNYVAFEQEIPIDG